MWPPQKGPSLWAGVVWFGMVWCCLWVVLAVARRRLPVGVTTANWPLPSSCLPHCQTMILKAIELASLPAAYLECLLAYSNCRLQYLRGCTWLVCSRKRMVIQFYDYFTNSKSYKLDFKFYYFIVCVFCAN